MGYKKLITEWVKGYTGKDVDPGLDLKRGELLDETGYFHLMYDTGIISFTDFSDAAFLELRTVGEMAGYADGLKILDISKAV